jgi:hypothetical protein
MQGLIQEMEIKNMYQTTYKYYSKAHLFDKESSFNPGK